MAVDPNVFDEKTEYVLLPTIVAGVPHHCIVEVVDALHKHTRLDLVPEPTNQFDASAVRVDYNGRKLGYIPASVSPIVARVIRAQHKLHALVVAAGNLSIKILVVGRKA